MRPLPHSAFPGAIFPAVAQTPAASLLALQYQLAESERLPPDALRQLQYRQLEALLAHAEHLVPFYATRLRDAGFVRGEPLTDAIWSRIPVLRRAEVQAAGTRLHSNVMLREHGTVGEVTTSGSSGKPVKLRKNALWQFYFQSVSLREELWHRRDWSRLALGIRRDDARKPDEPTGRLRRHPDWGAPLSTVYPTGPSGVLDYRAPISEQAETLLREQPGYLTTFPSILLELLRSGVRPQELYEVRTVGEALSDETRALCRERWDVPVTDAYSGIEGGLLAAQCPEYGNYHMQSETVLLEVLHADGTPCTPGETGMVVLTPLHNFAMPLVRYANDDQATVGHPCKCGRTLPVLDRIPGRARGMLVLANGERRFPQYGHGDLMRVDAIVQHQVVQKSFDEVEVGVVLKRPLSHAEERYLVEAAERALGPPFRVSLRIRAPIERGPGGKFAEFYSEVDG